MVDALKGFVLSLHDEGSPYAAQVASFRLECRLRLDG